MVKLTTWYILKKKALTSYTKSPERPPKTTKVDHSINLSKIKKNPFTTSNQVKNTLKAGRYNITYTGFTKRCKPSMTLKSKMTRLGFARKHLKGPAQL